MESEVAKIYARSLLDLGEKLSVDVYTELTKFEETILGCNELEQLLFLDIFSIEEKESVLKAIMEKLKLKEIVTHFIFFLLHERRINLLPLIYKEITVIDDEKKGFLRGSIEGNESKISGEAKKQILDYFEEKFKKKIEVEYKQTDKITAGYKITLGDQQMDATFNHQLSIFKDSVLKVKQINGASDGLKT